MAYMWRHQGWCDAARVHEWRGVEGEEWLTWLESNELAMPDSGLHQWKKSLSMHQSIQQDIMTIMIGSCKKIPMQHMWERLIAEGWRHHSVSIRAGAGIPGCRQRLADSRVDHMSGDLPLGIIERPLWTRDHVIPMFFGDWNTMTLS